MFIFLSSLCPALDQWRTSHVMFYFSWIRLVLVRQLWVQPYVNGLTIQSVPNVASYFQCPAMNWRAKSVIVFWNLNITAIIYIFVQWSACNYSLLQICCQRFILKLWVFLSCQIQVLWLLGAQKHWWILSWLPLWVKGQGLCDLTKHILTLWRW